MRRSPYENIKDVSATHYFADESSPDGKALLIATRKAGLHCIKIEYISEYLVSGADPSGFIIKVRDGGTP